MGNAIQQNKKKYKITPDHISYLEKAKEYGNEPFELCSPGPIQIALQVWDMGFIKEVPGRELSVEYIITPTGISLLKNKI